MSDTNESGFDRRAFLIRAAAAGAAAGAAAAVPAWLLTTAEGDGDSPQSASADAGAPLTQPMVAFVRDPEAGEVWLMAGTQELTVRDPVLASRLLAAASALAL